MKIPFWRWLWVIPLLFLGLFFIYPLLTILDVSLRPAGVFDFSGFSRLVSSDYYRNTLLFTFWQALLSTGLTIVPAIGGAYVFTRYQFPGKALLLSLATLPFVLPTVVVAAAFSALIGQRGLLNTLLMNLLALEDAPIQLERTLALILIAHVFYNYAVALRMIYGYWANQSPRIEEAARVLGCSGWRLWWEVRLPLLRPIILAASVLVFIFTFTSFGVVLILGGIRFATLEVQIYVQALNVFDLPLAAALSLVQIGFMLVLMLVYTRLQQRIRIELQSQEHIARPPQSTPEKIMVFSYVAGLLGFLFTPLLALIVRSVTIGGQGFTLEYYALLNQNVRDSILFVPPIQAIGNSVFFALLTTIAAVVLGILTAYLVAEKRRWLDAVFMLPLATSAVTLGFGYIIALDEPPLNLRASWILIPIAHTLVALPFVVRSVLPALRSLPHPVLESASVLGATPFYRWLFVELPLISRGIWVGATFAFTVSMGEFGASLFVARPDTPTIPIVIFRLLGQPGSANYGQAIAMSVILMGVCALSFMLIERLRIAGIGEF
jgi:thiamine transport system permease protein